MGAFGGLLLTNNGRNLQSKAIAGANLEFTRIAVGDGNLGGTSIVELNNLVNEKLSISINTLNSLSDGQAKVGGVLSNSSMTEGFYFREIGLFATDPDLGEILYCYGNAGGTADYIPAGGGQDLIEKMINIVALVGNAENISAVINESLVYVSNDIYNIEMANKVDKVDGKGLSTEDYSTVEKNKLAGIDDGANKYVHPETHLPSIITQDSNNRFVTDIEKATWNGKANVADVTDLAGAGRTNETVMGAYSQLGQMGDLATLDTIDKTTLVDAVNEVFQSGNNVKSNTVDALLLVDDSLPITAGSAWNDIVTQIGNISTGKKWATGEIITSNSFSITNLAFTPSYVMYYILDGTTTNINTVLGVGNKNNNILVEGTNRTNIFAVRNADNTRSFFGSSPTWGIDNITNIFAYAYGYTMKIKWYAFE